MELVIARSGLAHRAIQRYGSLMHDQRDLNLILNSRVPIVLVETHDEHRFLQFLTEQFMQNSGNNYKPLFRWTVTDGLQRLDIELEPQPTTTDPDQVLKHIRAVDKPGVYVLLDFHPYLEDPIHVRLLKDIALASQDGSRTVILVSHELTLPGDLERLSARFEVSLPDENERARIVRKVVKDWNAENVSRAEVDKQAFKLLVRNLSGLNRADTERLARNAVYLDGAIAANDLPAVMKAKYELLNQDGVLSYEYDTAAFSEIGGLRNLKVWLEQRKRVLQNTDSSVTLDPPKGLLLIGVQGCGKSLAAKAAAGILGVPLLRLDFGTLYNKFYGESERNLRESLQQAAVMSPCVLWIDEIEKGLASGSAENDGLSRRILGTFLTWLSEKEQTVFVVATANDISGLPPELVRKGRFDEIFFVDLPSATVRADILGIHIQRRDLELKNFDLVSLVEASHGFSGAEIEQGIVAALYAAHATGDAITTGHILAEFKRTRPLSILMSEKISDLKQWAADRTVAAD
ncbi:MAG: AAA family ATPase [Gammaproteobacteria bacterium]